MRGEAAPVAALPMYDGPELRAANDALWASIAARLDAEGIDAPAALTRDRAPDAVWRDPGLVLAQTCGHPFVTDLGGVARLVATPIYRAEGCDGPFYSSAIVARSGERGAALADFSCRRAAINGRDSQSGYWALLRAAKGSQPATRFSELVVTGSHLASLVALMERQADVAAIDAVTWAHARRHRPDLTDALTVLDWTPLTPALPFVTAARRGDEEVIALARALDGAIADPAMSEARERLLLMGVAVLDAAEYVRAYGGRLAA